MVNPMQQAEAKFKTLWNAMNRHRLRYAGALVAMFGGVGLLYITPLITRATIDGVIATRPGTTLTAPARFLAAHREHWGTELTLTLVAVTVIVVTASAAVFMSLQGRLSGTASE